jgi:hypothetical protein
MTRVTDVIAKFENEAILRNPENIPLVIPGPEHPDRDRFYYVNKDERILKLCHALRVALKDLNICADAATHTYNKAQMAGYAINEIEAILTRKQD